MFKFNLNNIKITEPFEDGDADNSVLNKRYEPDNSCDNYNEIKTQINNYDPNTIKRGIYYSEIWMVGVKTMPLWIS